MPFPERNKWFDVRNLLRGNFDLGAKCGSPCTKGRGLVIDRYAGLYGRLCLGDFDTIDEGSILKSNGLVLVDTKARLAAVLNAESTKLQYE